jgi:flagellar basal-body rod modification protein FlgD
MINDITAAAATASTKSATGAGSGSALGALDKDAFLQLLVAQLRYQNPLSPKDGQEYLAQAAQFATVEKLGNIEQAQTEAITYQQLLLSTSFVGKSVSGLPAGGTEAITGHVSSVVFDGGVPNLVVDGQLIPVGSVEHVTE